MDLQTSTVVLATVERGTSVDRTGWLVKLSGKAIRRSWKRRYCVLKGSILFYFKQQLPTEPVAGMINLRDYQAVIPDLTCKRSKFAFTLQPTAASNPHSVQAKPVHFYAENADYMDFWIASLDAKLVKLETRSTLDAALSRLGYQQPTSSATPPYSSSPSSTTFSPLVPRRSTLRTNSSYDSGGGGSRGAPGGTSSGVVSDSMSVESITSGGTLSWDDRAVALRSTTTTTTTHTDAGVPISSPSLTNTGVPGVVQSPTLSSGIPFAYLSPASSSAANASTTWRSSSQSSYRRLSTSVQELSRSRSSPYLHQIASSNTARSYLKLAVPEPGQFLISDEEARSLNEEEDDVDDGGVPTAGPIRVRSSTVGVRVPSLQSPSGLSTPTFGRSVSIDALPSGGGTTDGSTSSRKSLRTPIAEVAAEFGIVTAPEELPPPSLSPPSPPTSKHQRHHSLELMVRLVQEQLALTSSSSESLPI